MAGNKTKKDDPYARDSFSMRRMTRGQVWAITIVAIVIVVALIAYSYS
jgi:hypothetical protein